MKDGSWMLEEGSWKSEDGRVKFFVLFHLSEVYPELINEIPLFSFPLPERSRRQRKRKGAPIKSGCEKFEIKKYRRVNL